MLYFAGWKQHYSLYPATDRARRGVQGRARTVRGQGKGTIRFPLSEPVPVKLIEAHREVPREGSRRAREGEGGRAEEALKQEANVGPVIPIRRAEFRIPFSIQHSAFRIGIGGHHGSPSHLRALRTIDDVRGSRRSPHRFAGAGSGGFVVSLGGSVAKEPLDGRLLLLLSKDDTA